VQLEGLEAELKCLRENTTGECYKVMSLPEGMPASSADAIVNLNEHLIVALQVSFF